jgi:hypothetical protein
MWIRIQLISLMRIRIRILPLNLMRTQIRIHNTRTLQFAQVILQNLLRINI